MKRKTNEDFLKEVFEVVGDEYTPLSEYKGAREKLKMRHNTCGYEWDVQPRSFLGNGNRCPKCGVEKVAKRHRFTHEDFVRTVYDLVKEEYSVLGSYKNARTKVLIRHNKCGYEWDCYPDNFKRGVSRCPKCSGKAREGHDGFVRDVKLLTGDEYEVTGEYSGRDSKVTLRHMECGYEWDVKALHFMQGSRCPKCRESKGAKLISATLDSLGINYRIEERIDGCRDKYPLPFDFAIIEKDKISSLIEFDGEHHSQPIPNWGGELGFINVQRRDRIKDEFCRENDIPLLRINYDQVDSIDSIIKSWLKTAS